MRIAKEMPRGNRVVLALKELMYEDVRDLFQGAADLREVNDYATTLNKTTDG